MTGWVVINRAARGFRVWRQDRQPAGAIILPLDERMLERRVNATASQLAARIKNPLWALEIAKYAAQNLAAPLAAGFALSDVAGAGKGPIIAARVHHPRLVIYAATFELAARGYRVRGHALMSVKARVSFLAGAAVGLAAWFAAVLRFRPHGAGIPDTDVITAIYGQLSNRTRHMLPPAYDHGASAVFLIVGRPRASLHDIGCTIDPANRMPGKRLFRAISWRAVVASLPRAFAILARGLKLVSTLPIRIPLRECAAISFRILQGACEAHWWRRRGLRPKTVLFGLTGLADTTQLELAMQATGSQTVHCVHGVSLGWNFAAHSDVGLFACGHDAELARRFPGYGHTAYVASGKPGFVAGKEGWVVLTNYAHPMNAHLPSFGLDADRMALDIAAEAAEKQGQDPADIIWKPHPALAALPAAVRAALEAHAVAKGFRRWRDADVLSEIIRYGIVISTPSTAALDALRLGKMPILLTPHSLPDDIVYSRFPLRAGSCEGLCACIRTLVDDPSGLFAHAWAGIRPGGKLNSSALANVGLAL